MQQSSQKKRTFYILRESSDKKDDNKIRDEYAGLSAAQIDDIYKVVSILMDKKEKRCKISHRF